MLWACLSSIVCSLSVGAALENLSAARVGIMGEGTNACCSAVSIAVRYAAVRKQFGPKPDDTELPIIEYQLHVSSLAQCS
jgi:acyl-CoA oxidase